MGGQVVIRHRADRSAVGRAIERALSARGISAVTGPYPPFDTCDAVVLVVEDDASAPPADLGPAIVRGVPIVTFRPEGDPESLADEIERLLREGAKAAPAAEAVTTAAAGGNRRIGRRSRSGPRHRARRRMGPL